MITRLLFEAKFIWTSQSKTDRSVFTFPSSPSSLIELLPAFVKIIYLEMAPFLYLFLENSYVTKVTTLCLSSYFLNFYLQYNRICWKTKQKHAVWNCYVQGKLCKWSIRLTAVILITFECSMKVLQWTQLKNPAVPVSFSLYWEGWWSIRSLNSLLDLQGLYLLFHSPLKTAKQPVVAEKENKL